MWLIVMGLKGWPVAERTPRRLSSAAASPSLWWSRSRSISAMISGGVRRISVALGPTVTVEGVGLAGFEADSDGDGLVFASQGDVFDEQSDHTFAFPLRGARIGPQGRKICCQCCDPRLVAFGERRGAGGLAFVFVLGGGQSSQ